MSWSSSARARLALAALAVLALVLDGRLAHGSDASLALVVVLALATCLPFLSEDRFAPAGVLWLEAGLVVCVLVFRAYDASVGILVIVLFLAALEGDRRRSLIVGGTTALLLALTLVLLQRTGPGVDEGAPIRVLLVLGALVLGDALRSRRELRAARHERELRATLEREQSARDARTRERLAVARELHDTLAHALVAINVRAGVATHLGHERQDPAALAEIKDVSAQALRDLRATLDLLRDGAEDSPWLPAEGLEELPRLVDVVGSAGLEAHSHIDLDGAVLPAPVSQTAFRIVQESLTNVLRHAGASRADVKIHASGELLAVEVVDDGHGGANPDPGGVGHGLRGMSERALALGGELSAGPLEPAGWRVFAQLPIDPGRAER